MKARYTRISTANQNHERQLINEAVAEKLFMDICSGSVPFGHRDRGKDLICSVENGDIYYLSVHAVDRLGRNLLDILQTLQFLDDKNITVKIDNLGMESRVKDKPNPAFKLIISVLANISEMERETMLERQREGIAIAKANGNYKGRLRGSKEVTKDFLGRYPKVIKELNSGFSMRKVAKLCDCSLGTVQKVSKLISN
jgi:DNA invertase Pin-like site-specific DNA recombinase